MLNKVLNSKEWLVNLILVIYLKESYVIKMLDITRLSCDSMYVWL